MADRTLTPIGRIRIRTLPFERTESNGIIHEMIPDFASTEVVAVQADGSELALQGVQSITWNVSANNHAAECILTIVGAEIDVQAFGLTKFTPLEVGHVPKHLPRITKEALRDIIHALTGANAQHVYVHMLSNLTHASVDIDKLNVDINTSTLVELERLTGGIACVRGGELRVTIQQL